MTTTTSTLNRGVAHRVTRPLQYLALLGYMVFLGFPLLWLILVAFKTPQELNSPNPTFLPQQFNFDNFVDAIARRTSSPPPGTASSSRSPPPSWSR